MKPIFHDIIVKTDDPLHRELKSKIKDLYLEPTYDVNRNRKIFAEVVEVPSKLKGVAFYEESVGFPSPTPTRVGGTHLPKYVTCMDQKITIKKGDKVYFHYLTMTEQNYVGKDADGMELFKCKYDNVFCVIRDGIPIMQNGYILVKPYFDESFEEIEIDNWSPSGRIMGKKKVRVKQSDKGIIYDVNEKPVFGYGVVGHIGDPIRYDMGVTQGAKIIYTKNSEFENEIEGEKYFVMKQWDVVANQDLSPYQDYVLVLPKFKKKYSIIFINENFIPDPTEGRVVKVGPMCKYVKAGDWVNFNYGSFFNLDLSSHDGIFIKENQIWSKKIEDEEDTVRTVKMGDKEYYYKDSEMNKVNQNSRI